MIFREPKTYEADTNNVRPFNQELANARETILVRTGRIPELRNFSRRRKWCQMPAVNFALLPQHAAPRMSQGWSNAAHRMLCRPSRQILLVPVDGRRLQRCASRTFLSANDSLHRLPTVAYEAVFKRYDEEDLGADC